MKGAKLQIARRFRASPEKVFAACTDPTVMARWFGPKDFRVTELNAEVRQGGTFAFRMVGPPGEMAAGGTYELVEPPTRLVHTWRWTDGLAEFPPDGITSRITYEFSADGSGTRLPPDKIERLADAYQEKDGQLAIFDPAKAGDWSKPPVFEAGDSGLDSTADDYLAFCRMLLSGGQYNGKALLSPASVRAMTTNYLTDKQRADGAPILAPGRGWGYGMSVVVDQTQGGPPPGSFGWNGGFGTSNINDPANNLVLILLTQHVFQSPDGDPIHADYQAAAYRAIK